MPGRPLTCSTPETRAKTKEARDTKARQVLGYRALEAEHGNDWTDRHYCDALGVAHQRLIGIRRQVAREGWKPRVVCFGCGRHERVPDHKVCAACHDEDACPRCFPIHGQPKNDRRAEARELEEVLAS